MNNVITENTLKRIQTAHERRMERIIKHEQEGRERCSGLKFKVVGILNMFDIIPGFVEPIFVYLQDEPEEPNVMNKPFYLQVGEGEKDSVSFFEKLDSYSKVKQRVLLLNAINTYTGVQFNINSKPLYAFQYSENEVMFGNYSEMKEFLEKYQTEDEILKEEIQDFLDLESKNIWVRVKEQLERNFPNDSEVETDMKIRTLRNNESEGKKLELYIPKFKDTVLRVGVRVKGEKKKVYFTTTEGEELEDLLND